MKFEPLTAEHVCKLGPLVAIHADYELTPEFALDLEDVGGGMACVDDDGSVIAIAGIMTQWRGVGLAWAWLSKDWRRHARAITEKMVEMLDSSDFHRIEVAVRCDFDAGHRWVDRLGFHVETPCAKAWGPDKADYTIHVRLI